jgi:hypothetical protein
LELTSTVQVARRVGCVLVIYLAASFSLLLEC